MNNSIFIATSPAFILLCIVFAFLLTYLLYKGEKRLGNIKSWKYRILISLRFMFILFISLLLLSPFIESKKKTIEPPILVFAQDNSQSIVNNKDSAFYLRTYKKKIDSLIDNLSDKFIIRKYTFGQRVKKDTSFTFNEKMSDYSHLFSELKNRYANRNLGAIIVAGDGLYNKGLNPIYEIENIVSPIYSLLLGDSSEVKDASITTIQTNQVAYLGNNFPVKIQIAATQLKDQNTLLEIYHNNNKLIHQNILFRKNNAFLEYNFNLKATKKGNAKFEVLLHRIDGEFTDKNNRKDFYIEVIDSKTKILLIPSVPHPDISALKSTIENNDFFECQVWTSSLNIKDFKYDLVIMHQIPDIYSDKQAIIKEIINKKIPLLFIFGQNLSIPRFNALNIDLKIEKKAKFKEIVAVLNTDFSLFDMDSEFKNILEHLPPLYILQNTIYSSGASNTLLFTQAQRYGNQMPLLTFYSKNTHKIGVIAGEGLWKWKMMNYVSEQSHLAFNKFIYQTIQYLSLKENKETIFVQYKNLINENEPVVFNVEIYNQNRKRTNKAVLDITITDGKQKKRNYPLYPTGDSSYYLSVGLLPIDDYKFSLNAHLGNEIISKKGSFTITPFQLEYKDIKADAHLMYQLTKNNKEQFHTLNTLNQLVEHIKQNENIVSKSKVANKITNLINNKEFFFLILLFISIEWFIRKFNGVY